MRGLLERQFLPGSGPNEGTRTIKIRGTDVTLQYYQTEIVTKSPHSAKTRPTGAFQGPQ